MQLIRKQFLTKLRLIIMKHALVVSGLKKTYDGGKVALQGIDLTVEEGDFFALLGPNGAGKSTLIGISCGLVNKTSGEEIGRAHV